MSKVAVQSKGLFNLAYVNAHDTILGREGEMVEVFKEFNQSTIPAIIAYGVGPKRIDTGMKVESQTAGAMLGQGAKAMYQSLRMFLGTLVTVLRPSGLASFFTRPNTHLPRVLLVTDKKEVTATLKKLSLDFSSRAVFGQLHVDEDGGKLAKAFNVTKGETKLPVLLTSAPDVSAFGGFKKGSKPSTPWNTYTGNMSYDAMRLHLHTTLPLAPLPQARSADDFARLCSNATDVTLCFIGILPHDAEAASVDRSTKLGEPEEAFIRSQPFELVDEDDADADEDEEDEAAAAKRRAQAGGKAFDALARVASKAFIRPDWATVATELKTERIPIAFLWIDADEQRDFAAAFKLSAPALIGLNPRKKKFAAMRGSFQPRNINDFVVAMIEVGMPARPKTGNPDADAAQDAAAARAAELVKLDSIASLPALKKQAALAAKKGTGKKGATGKGTSGGAAKKAAGKGKSKDEL